MATDDKTLEFDKSKKKAPKNKKSIGWIIGVVVLILISITFILPATMFTPNAGDIVFGSYNREKISYMDTYFQRQLNNVASQYQGDPNSFEGAFTVWNQAFLSTALNIALNQEAKKAGIKAADEWVDMAIINSGVYNGEDGTFSTEIYNSTSNYDKSQIRDFIERSVPASMVANDIAGVKSSKGEVAAVQQIAAAGRSFEYVVIDRNAYPDELAVEYANNNPQPFMQVGVNQLTVLTEDEANTILASIRSGEKTFQQAVEESSIDSYKSSQGERGGVMLGVLESETVNAEDANKVFSTAVGEIAGPIQTSLGYSLYEVTEAPGMADMTDGDVLSSVKSYIASNSSDIISTYLAEQAQSFQDRLASGENYYDLADEYGYEIVDVAATTPNPASFPLFSSFGSNDPYGYLYYATYMDPNLVTTLYESEDDAVLSTVDVSGAKIIVKTGAESENTSTSSLISTIYPSLQAEMALSDMQNGILTDDTAFVNNFYSVFFSQILGSTASN